jgi:sec-independent protein translocase protein TatA
MGIDNPVHLIFIAAVALLVLGPKRLPEVARSLGKGIRELREAMGEGSAGGFVHAHEDEPAVQVDPASQVDPVQQVDPPEPVRSGDAPDRRPL